MRHPDLQLDAGPAHLPSKYLTGNFSVATSGVCSHATLLATVVDHPYESTADAVAFLVTAPFTEADRQRIAHGNAERLLGLPAAR
ncbi:hypothetical protein [Streptomyces flaveolus]|uniref:hypothetical protein n=1 Tax=Streptomyces flaveolus TaxID=67297 RepID=UPI0033D51D1B